MVKLVCVSDTHMKHNQIDMPDGDILIHCGDMTGTGNYAQFIEVGMWFEKMKRKFKHRIFIAGNHDITLEDYRNTILKDCFDKDIIYLQDSGVELEGIKFYGTPWMPRFYDWAFMREEDELAGFYAKIPDDTEVLLTHCPPFGILDTNSNKDKCGSTSLYARIKQLKNLKHHFFGHIHQGAGSLGIDDVMFHNASSLNDLYMYTNKPTIVEV